MTSTQDLTAPAGPDAPTRSTRAPAVPAPPVATAAKPHAAPGRRVAIFGGGMSGLVAAHELIERGFEVDVYEARARARD